MKRMRNFLLALVSMLICLAVIVPAYAAPLIQDGLEITFATNKDQYAQQDAIQAILTVKNTNDLAKPVFSLDIETPAGYELSESSQEIKDSYSLMPGETLSLSVLFNVLGAGALPPKTGDSSQVGLWVALMVAAALGLLVIKMNLWKRFVSLLLCVVLLGSLFADVSVANAAANDRTSIKLQTMAHVGEQQIAINATIQYAFLPFDAWLDMNDTDGDGLVKGLEEYYGTDLNDKDTDNDGLS